MMADHSAADVRAEMCDLFVSIRLPIALLPKLRYKLPQLIIITASALCAALNGLVPAVAAETQRPLGWWFSRTTSGCGFSIPSSFVSGLGRLSEESLPASWSSSCVDGLVSGLGTLRGLRDDKVLFSYTGTMLNGAPDGVSIFHRVNGTTISATLHVGTLTGPVVVLGVNGFRYEGGWSERGPEGYGVEVRANGSRYDGEWLEGAQTGHGTMVDALGNRYEGEFRSGKRNGYGTFFYSTGIRLEANWVEGEAVGPASVISPTGARYEGDFRAGGPEGHGTAVEANGDRYEGEWHDAVPDGIGTLVQQADRSEFKGQWTRGCFVEGERHAAFHVDPSACPRR